MQAKMRTPFIKVFRDETSWQTKYVCLENAILHSECFAYLDCTHVFGCSIVAAMLSCCCFSGNDRLLLVSSDSVPCGRSRLVANFLPTYIHLSESLLCQAARKFSNLSSLSPCVSFKYVGKFVPKIITARRSRLASQDLILNKFSSA